MLKITAKILPDNDKVKAGNLVVYVDDGIEACKIKTGIHCEPREIPMGHMSETIHIIKHLYSIVEEFHHRNCPYVADIIVQRFHKTYDKHFNPKEIEFCKLDSRIADVSIIMA